MVIWFWAWAAILVVDSGRTACEEEVRVAETSRRRADGTYGTNWTNGVYVQAANLNPTVSLAAICFVEVETIRPTQPGSSVESEYPALCGSQ
jgi:hypothetical protein